MVKGVVADLLELAHPQQRLSCCADGAAQRRNVTLVRIVGDRAVVKGELAAGEKVIVDGAQRVTQGTKAMERTPQPQRVSSN